MPSPQWAEIAEQGAIGLAEYYLEGGMDAATVRGILSDHFPGYTASSYNAIISRAADSIQAAEFLEFEAGGSALADVLIPVDPSKEPGYYYKAKVTIRAGEDVFERYVYDRFMSSMDLSWALADIEAEALSDIEDSAPEGVAGPQSYEIVSSVITSVMRGEAASEE